MLHRRFTWHIVLGLSLLTIGCGKEPHYPAPPRLALDSLAATVRFGILEGGADPRVVSQVRHAVLSESGRVLAVGDRDPPFLRLLDRETGKVIAFGEEGDGPGELAAAGSLSLVGDSVLLVHSHRGRIDAYSRSGEWLRGINVKAAGLLDVSSFTRACGDRWFVVGVDAEYRNQDTVAVLYEVDRANGPAVRPRGWVQRPMARIPYVRGFDESAGDIIVWLDWLDHEAGLQVPCAGGPTKTWSAVDHGPDEGERSVRLGGGVHGAAVTLSDTFVAAVAANDRGIYRATWPWARADDSDATKLRVFLNGSCMALELIGEWNLHDVTEDEVVLSRRDPFPQVWVMPLHELERHMVPASCDGL